MKGATVGNGERNESYFYQKKLPFEQMCVWCGWVKLKGNYDNYAKEVEMNGLSPGQNERSHGREWRT